MPNRWWVVPGIAAAAVVLAACGSSTTPPSSSSTTNPAANAASVAIKTMSTSKGTVLVTASGLTLYWFANDTATQSNCNGSCASYWKPLLGSAAAVSGASLPHGFGTVKRSDGQLQITYDGHPLYTYTGDTTSGQLNGNGLDASGGMWWAITPTGSELGASTAASTSGSSSSGSSSSGSSGSGSSGSGGSMGGGGW
jgi:predicted lipoprotein with Yx(FWY)xxD motif